MSSRTRTTYALPVEQTGWVTPLGGEVDFTWDYDSGRDKLLGLYEKGKNLQWNAQLRIDWSTPVDKDNPLLAPEFYNPIYGSPVWDKLDERGRSEARLHATAWQFSQFLHGEQGALVCAAKIVQTVPDLDAKYYAATQVMDEARHVEAFSRYLRDKLELAYPINPHLRTLLDQVLRDPRWDITYLGMQILIEGLALAAFGTIRDLTSNSLGRSLNAFVMQDEARHVAFGRFALRDYYPQLSEAERAEREEFAIEACALMRDRFSGEEAWRRLGFGQDVIDFVKQSPTMREFQRMLFSRIVPALREIGLFGPRMQRALEQMGVLAFADTDLNMLAEMDDAIAAEFDAQRRAADAHIAQTIAQAPDAPPSTDEP